MSVLNMYTLLEWMYPAEFLGMIKKPLPPKGNGLLIPYYELYLLSPKMSCHTTDICCSGLSIHTCEYLES